MSEQINTVFWQELLGWFKLYSPLNWEELEQILDTCRAFFFTDTNINVEIPKLYHTKVLKLVELFGALEAESNIKHFLQVELLFLLIDEETAAQRVSVTSIKSQSWLWIWSQAVYFIAYNSSSIITKWTLY